MKILHLGDLQPGHVVGHLHPDMPGRTSYGCTATVNLMDTSSNPVDSSRFSSVVRMECNYGLNRMDVCL